MKPSEFQTTIENQFDYICKVAMEDERKDYLKALSRQCKRETLFCDMDDYTVNLFSSEDTYPSHFHTFEMDGFTVRIENSLLAEALENLDGKKRDVILRYYFLGFDDTEISKILEVNRSTIQTEISLLTLYFYKIPFFSLLCARSLSIRKNTHKLPLSHL